jgi:tetratricopeptide (TPR) repeat protein
VENIRGHRVFIASPGGLEAERRAVRDVLAKFNEEESLTSGSAFFPYGWEQVTPGVGRPQGLINDEISRSDYMVLLFKDRWGSPPARGGQYSSGTEEEFFEAIKHLADVSSPMRNILVLFAKVEDARLRDPGTDLQKVLNFRNMLEESKQILFGSFDDQSSLSVNVARSLKDWAASAGTTKAAVSFDMASNSSSHGRAPDEAKALVERAEELAQRSLHLQAETLFAKASESGEPAARASYAKYMRRRGQLKTARDINDSLITSLSLVKSRSVSDESILIETLANNAVLEKARGDVAGGLRFAREAVATAAVSPLPVASAHGYALDVLGGILEAAGRTEDAVKAYEQSSVIRGTDGTEVDRIQSAINLARMHSRLGDQQKAINLYTESLIALESENENLLRAKALAGRSVSLEKLGKLGDAEADARQAFDLNDTAGNSNGVSISLNRLARLALAHGDAKGALGYAAAILEESANSGNAVGRAEGLRISALGKRLDGDPAAATALIEESLREAEATNNPALVASIAGEFSRMGANPTTTNE